MGISVAPEVRPESAAGVLSAARARRRTADAAEAELLALAVDWAVIHPAESIHEPATYTLRGFGQTDLALAGPGAPTVADYAIPEFRRDHRVVDRGGETLPGRGARAPLPPPQTLGLGPVR